MAENQNFVSYPFLAVSNMTEATAFYCDVLGFEFVWGDEVTAAVVRNGLMIRLMDNPELASQVKGHAPWDGHLLWIEVPDVDALYEEHRRRGAKIIMELETQPWSFREYTVEDPNGYQLRFGQWVDPDEDS